MSVLQAAYNDLALTNSRLRAEIERLRRWVYATARSLEKSGLSLEEYNAITVEVCRALEPSTLEESNERHRP